MKEAGKGFIRAVGILIVLLVIFNLMKPMIYGNLKSYFGMLEINRLKDYDLWFAYYDSSIYFPYKIKMWQYTESGTVNGINGNVDLNITFE